MRGYPSPVRGDVLERAVALRILGKQWNVIAAELGGVTADQVKGAVRKHNQAAGVLDSTAVPLPATQGNAEREHTAGVVSSVAPAVTTTGHFDPEPLPPAGPAVHTSKSRAEAYLVVPDLQAPFHEPMALDFCERVRREFAIPKDNVLLVGDEVDNFHGKGLERGHDPDADHTPKQELAAAVEEMKRWYAAYPNVRLAVSNHGTRYDRKRVDAEISSQWMRLYRDVIHAPSGWEWREHWIIKGSKQSFVLEHGHQGKRTTEGKMLESGLSTTHGHIVEARTLWMTNHFGRRLWGMSVGALIDYDTYAFKYARKYPRRPDMGCGVVVDGGRMPFWIPYYA